jgi:hypothetical protein
LYVERERSPLVQERRAHYLCSFNSDVVSQLERDISTALRTVCESKNSFARINCILLDILSLIPTQLPSQQDLFRATFVCRHWRRVFLQQGALWSQLFTGKDKDYITTLLTRAKGSTLGISFYRDAPFDTTMLLSPYARQIGHLAFSFNHWTEILKFSEAISGPLPLLCTLKMWNIKIYNPNMLTGPSLRLFGGATNLKELDLEPQWTGMLNHFVFPNLTTFKLSAPPMDGFNTSDLFDFLKASPTLQTVKVRINWGVVDVRATALFTTQNLLHPRQAAERWGSLHVKPLRQQTTLR